MTDRGTLPTPGGRKPKKTVVGVPREVVDRYFAPKSRIQAIRVRVKLLARRIPKVPTDG